MNNGLLRVADSSTKHDNSLFRALSIAVFYSPLYTAEVISEIRLTLMGNLGDKRSNAYPVIHDSPVLKKYQAMSELLLDFWASPELPCYQNVGKDSFRMCWSWLRRHLAGTSQSTHSTRMTTSTNCTFLHARTPVSKGFVSQERPRNTMRYCRYPFTNFFPTLRDLSLMQ